MPDNSTDVKVGKLIAVIVEKGDDWKNVEVPKTEAATASQKPAEAKKAEAKDASKSQKESQPQQQQQAEPSQYVSAYLRINLIVIFFSSVMLSVQPHEHF